MIPLEIQSSEDEEEELPAAATDEDWRSGHISGEEEAG